jgi:hypothetical protein
VLDRQRTRGCLRNSPSISGRVQYCAQSLGLEFLQEPDALGKTPAHIAARHGRGSALLDIASRLGRANCARAVDHLGETVAHEAARCGIVHMLEMCEVLGGPELLRQTNCEGETVAHAAASAGQVGALAHIATRLGEDFLRMAGVPTAVRSRTMPRMAATPVCSRTASGGSGNP